MDLKPIFFVSLGQKVQKNVVKSMNFTNIDILCPSLQLSLYCTKNSEIQWT